MITESNCDSNDTHVTYAHLQSHFPNLELVINIETMSCSYSMLNTKYIIITNGSGS